jgi:hypothetical protein
MPVLYFKSQFAPLVKSGEKRQTIRTWSNTHSWTVGDKLYLYASDPRLILRTEILRSVQFIDINMESREVRLAMPLHNGGREWPLTLSDDEAQALAQADGFASLDDFFEFFKSLYGRHMTGYLLKW